MLVTSCLANQAVIMQQFLHLESPQEMHHFMGSGCLAQILTPTTTMMMVTMMMTTSMEGKIFHILHNA